MATISKEDVIDAIDDESESRLDLLTDYWQALVDEHPGSVEQTITHSRDCAKMLFDAKKYQDTLDWLDGLGLLIAKSSGEESDLYTAFIEDDELENLRMEALDRSGLEEEEDFEIDDE